MAKDQVKVLLQVTAQAGSKEELIKRLYDQAVGFFEDEPFVLEGEIKVSPTTEVGTAGGESIVIAWEGDAWFISENM